MTARKHNDKNHPHGSHIVYICHVPHALSFHFCIVVVNCEIIVACKHLPMLLLSFSAPGDPTQTSCDPAADESDRVRTKVMFHTLSTMMRAPNGCDVMLCD